MRIFNISRRYTSQGEVLDSVSVNLNVADVKVIVSSLEKFKTDDSIILSAKEQLLSNLKKIM